MTPATLEGIILPPEAEGGALVQVQQQSVLALFTTPGMVPALLEHIGAEARKDFTPDLTTDKGRKAIASRAFAVAKTKTAIDDLGKDEVARLKELPKQVDNARKLLRDGLDSLRDELRQPLTDWEARVEANKRRIADIQNIPGGLLTANANAATIQEAITTLEAVDTSEAAFQEFAAEATSTRTMTLATLYQQLEDRKKWEHDQAELARLREEERLRKEEEEKERLRKEGEERARKALEEQQAIIKANADAKAAEKPAPQPEPVPLMAHDDAILPPVPVPVPVAAPLPLPVADALRRGVDPTGDLEHRRTFNREALADLHTAIFNDRGQTTLDIEPIAKAVLTAIVTGKVRHIAITY